MVTTEAGGAIETAAGVRQTPVTQWAIVTGE